MGLPIWPFMGCFIGPSIGGWCIHQLYQWVDSGHDVHDNPWGIRSMKTGSPCDFLEALNILESRKAWMAKMKVNRE